MDRRKTKLLLTQRLIWSPHFLPFLLTLLFDLLQFFFRDKRLENTLHFDTLTVRPSCVVAGIGRHGLQAVVTTLTYSYVYAVQRVDD